MEQSGIQEILTALELHSQHMDNKLDKMKTELENRMDKRFDRIEERIERVEIKFDGTRMELTETQETVDYVLSKSVQHEKKIRDLSKM